MHINITYFTFAWPLVLAGLLPATCFLRDFRPKKWFRAAQIDASGWVILVTLYYLSSALQLVFGVHAPDQLSAIVDLIALAAIDGLVWHRIIYWKKFTKSLESVEDHEEV